jgi:uncharacterized membrane protein YhaH (DUF805 family)
MKKSPKRLDRPTFRKWAFPLVLGVAVLPILPLYGAALSVGGLNAVVIVRLAVTLARLVLIVLLAMALARRFRDIGWPAWIGPTILLVTMLGLPIVFLVYASDVDISEWAPTVAWTSDSLSLLLVIVAGFVPGKPASIEVAHVFD